MNQRLSGVGKRWFLLIGFGLQGVTVVSDELVHMQGERRPPRNLLKDDCFWGALSIGVTACLMLAMQLGVEAGDGAVMSQWQLFAWLVVIFPVLEEWLFRGVLQPHLLSRSYGAQSLWGITLANTWTTLAFAAAHLLTHTPLWALLVIAPSLLFGWFRDRYNSILPGLILHICYNLVYYAVFGLPGQ